MFLRGPKPPSEHSSEGTISVRSSSQESHGSGKSCKSKKAKKTIVSTAQHKSPSQVDAAAFRREKKIQHRLALEARDHLAAPYLDSIDDIEIHVSKILAKTVRAVPSALSPSASTRKATGLIGTLPSRAYG